MRPKTDCGDSAIALGALLALVSGAPALGGERAVPSGDPSGAAMAVIVRETTPDRTRREAPPEELLRVREQMEEAYQAGLEAYKAGRFDEAKVHFDRAVEVVLGSGLDLGEQPALRRAFDEIVRDIADLEADLFSRDAGADGQGSRSPLDELKDITTHLSPEEAEKEREKIREVVGQISYDIPIVLNAKVLAYIEVFQTRLRGEFEAGLKRSGAYLPLIKRIFREEGLPEDLAYMAHQESAFKNNAYSRARAKGMWQFMSYTGRKYGLKRDMWIDERSDFEKATRAAAAYLKALHRRYGDWYLAMAAYNAGEGKIDRAIRRARTRDYWALARTRYIRRETKYYVPAILASILIDKSPADYGFDVDIDPELKWDTVAVDTPTDLRIIAEAAGVSLKTIRALNPELRRHVTPPNVRTYSLRVPERTGESVLARLENIPADKRVSWTLHKVRRGETFSSIAARYRVPLRALLDANPRHHPRRLRRGAVLVIPLNGVTPHLLRTAAREDRPRYEPGERVVHRVRRGENLQRIAWKYRTTVRNLRRWNSLDGSLIRPGQRLVAYYGEKGSGPRPRARASGAPVSVAGGRLIYRVQRGDSLWAISRKFGVRVDDLCRWNGLTRRSVLQPGDRVRVGEGSPPGAGKEIHHRVRRGETLSHIARRYSVTVRQVRAWNNIYGTSLIYPGQILTIRVN
ncbi:MAG: LysM peptidoglycan-binding domain-containing protein [Acidobacteriota bacterium]